MKANELRIGNIIKWDDESQDFVTVIRIDTKHNSTAITTNQNELAEIEEFEPIKITENWLIKFGFETIRDSDDFKDFKLIILREEDSRYDGRVGVIYLYSNTQFLNEDVPSVSLIYNIENDGDKDLFNGISRGTNDIKYVHELQNLYFALTGVELQLSST